ncbi:MAG: ABC transporter ATP-binding protein/permease [Desulfobacterales bacterium]|jgi:ATP-binding cassette subfamily B protein|nr:ABC transporter ATP-binding protein/permease [Desulfobacterales bacterium]MDH3877104.1 ABC transporter ATP-binding protein/permease [Desulfobacterales bacterium]MDH4009456.1 ABC transporter ATP-binding protein/permease [Desulfobacterales bacterium]
MHPDYGYFEEAQLGKPYDVKLLKRLLPFIQPYKLLILWSIFLVIGITALDLALPYVTKVAIDRYIVPQTTDAAGARARSDGTRSRYLKADLKNPRQREVAQKYSALFRIEGQTALISFDELARLEKSDLKILRQKDFGGLAKMAAIFLAIVFFNFILNFTQKMIMEYSGLMIMHDLRMKLFIHIQHLAIEFFTRNPVGRLVTRVTNDVQNMHELFTSVISLVFKDCFLLVGIASVMLVLNWKLALVSFTVLPIVIFASAKFSVKARDVFRTLRIKIAEINTRFSETIEGIRVIQLLGQEAKNYQKFNQLNHENYLAGMRQIHVLAVFMPIIELLGVTAAALVIFYGGSRVLNDTLSLGTLVAFISYIRMFFRPIRDLAEKYNILQNAMSSAERILLILDTENTLAKTRLQISPPALGRIREIRLEDVSFSYIGDEKVLKNITLQINAGETIAVVGPTGAGKTSLVNLMPRFYDPTSGRILINDIDIRKLDSAVFRDKMALVMQEPFLFSGTIRQNIFEKAGHTTEEAVQEIIDAANCRTLIQRLPDGLETVLTGGGTSISSGERQLISIARAFARNPQLILFDEATSYIDSQTEQWIQQALEKLMKNRTAMIIAHRLSTVRHVDRIIVLNRGRIIETGSHAELMDQQGFYYRLSQFQK